MLTAADKGARHGTYALRLFLDVGPIDPESGENDRGPSPEDPQRGPGDRAVLTENGLVRQFGEKLREVYSLRKNTRCYESIRQVPRR